MTDKLATKYEKLRESANNRIIGKRFGRLVVLNYSHDGSSHHKYFICRCDCGKEKPISRTHLVTGKTVSCGCAWQEKKHEYRKSHGGSYESLYNTWCGIKERCNNKKSNAYKNYGGRGITVCKEWSDYGVFREWAITHGYNKDLEIDRKDNNGIYSPDNCHFVTAKENGRNKRNNRILEICGIKATASEWAEKKNISITVLLARIDRLGWSVQDAVNTPVKTQRRKT